MQTSGMKQIDIPGNDRREEKNISMDVSAAITTSIGVLTQADFEAYKKAVHQVFVCHTTNIKIEADLYITPLDVLRRTRLDSD